MKEDYSKTPLIDLLDEMNHLEQEINMKLFIYEEMRKEIVNRFPPIEKEDAFKPKVLTIKKNNKGV